MSPVIDGSCALSEYSNMIGMCTEMLRTATNAGFFVVVVVCLHCSSQQPASHGKRKPPLVGKYQVCVGSFEQTALPTLQLSPLEDDDSVGISPGSENKKRLFAIDEIGKMELFSHDFIEVVQAVFQCPDVVVLATIPVARQKSHWLVEELRQRPDCMLFEVWKGRGRLGREEEEEGVEFQFHSFASRL